MALLIHLSATTNCFTWIWRWFNDIVLTEKWNCKSSNVFYLPSGVVKLCRTLDMACSTTHSQENTSSGESDDELFFVGVSDISKQVSPLNHRDKAWSNPKRERKPVKIRPPSPTSPQQRPAGRSFSCEPPPKPIIHRRAQSLPSPSERRRMSGRIGVRFVDSLGMDLENVKVFRSGEDPFVPEHVLFRLLMNAELAANKSLEISLPYLKPVFPEQPGDCSNFLERLCNQQVCLERILCYEPGIIGIVQVVNLAFEKEVIARYSFTNWKSCAEIKACWVANKYLEGRSCDSFRFHLPVPPFILHPGAVLEFAVCYKVQGTQFWDNNEGQNYKLVCQSYKIPVPKECEDSMIHFVWAFWISVCTVYAQWPLYSLHLPFNLVNLYTVDALCRYTFSECSPSFVIHNLLISFSSV